MTHLDKILPEKWEMVVNERTRRLYYEGLKNLYTNKLMLDECEACPMLEIRIREAPAFIWIVTACRVQGNKCIKQYPHRIDNKEFK